MRGSVAVKVPRPLDEDPMAISGAATVARDHEYLAFVIELVDDPTHDFEIRQDTSTRHPSRRQDQRWWVMYTHAYLSSQCGAAELPQVHLWSLLDADLARSGCTSGWPNRAEVQRRAQGCRARGHADDGRLRYASEYEMERHVRSALVTTIDGSTSEIQRDIIGKT